MTEMSQRSTSRVPDTDWAEVLSLPDEHSLALGHLKNVSEGGLSLELPVCLQPGLQVRIKLSRMAEGILRRFELVGTVVHAETWGQGCVHGIRFSAMTTAERQALTDYFCDVEYRYRAAS